MSYIEHAKREFLALGYKPIDQEEDGPNKQGQREVCTEDWETIYPMWIIQAKDNLQEMMK